MSHYDPNLHQISHLPHLTLVVQFRTIPPHPNVVNFLGYCETPCCIVLKWYPTNLKTFILDDNSPFTLDLFEKFSYEIARGMEHIHVNGVVHFDLKPLNIFLEEETDANLSLNGGWRCVIGDFGVRHCKYYRKMNIH